MSKSSFPSDPLDSTEVQKALQKALVPNFYLDRIMEAIRHICIGNNARSGYTVKSVGKWFPRTGSFIFVRIEDDRTFRLRLHRGRWICKEEPKGHIVKN